MAERISEKKGDWKESEWNILGVGCVQVDYGHRSCCQETAGTRDAGLLGNQLNVMASIA